MTEVLPRRERVRLETTAEIKQRAWALMAHDGVDALSLRAVARQMGMAPSALYRYFASRNDLLSALIVDGFESLADALRVACDQALARGADAADTWLAVCAGYRGWAIAHPTEFALIYSTSIPDYQGTAETTAAAVRAPEVMLDVLECFLAEGIVDLDRIGREIEGDYADELAAWSRQGGRDLPPAALAVAMRCWVTLHGLIHLEMNEHYPPPLKHSRAQFEAILRAVSASLGPS